jgi:hypothetical protein
MLGDTPETKKASAADSLDKTLAFSKCPVGTRRPL